MRKKIVVWYHRITNFFYYLKTFLTSSVLIKYENHISAVNFHNFFSRNECLSQDYIEFFYILIPPILHQIAACFFSIFVHNILWMICPHLSSSLILKLFEMQNYTGQCAFKIFKQKIDFIKFDFSECEVFSKNDRLWFKWLVVRTILWNTNYPFMIIFTDA